MKKRWALSLVILAGLMLPPAFVQSQSPARTNIFPQSPRLGAASAARPEDVGLSSDRLERITRAIQQSVDEGRISGGVALVARHGKVAYFQAVGMADRDAHKPMRPDTIFRICSMSKPITSVAVMMLYEEGRFTLSDPVSNYLPEFKHMKVLEPAWPEDKTSLPGKLVDASRPITIFQLLTHTAGLTYPWNPRVGKAYRDAGVGSGLKQQEGTIADGVKRLAAIPLLFQPGDYWEYSLADDVLGRLVEVVSGMPFDQFLEKRIYQPLGMKDTYFFPPADKVPRLARAYAYDEKTGLRPILDNEVLEAGGLPYTADYPYRGPHTYFSGGGGLCSTAEDYYRFCQMMLNGGESNGARIISRKSVELMSMNHVKGKPDGNGYGLGFGVNSEPMQLKELGSVGAYYWGGFYYTAFDIDPKEDMIIIFMGQLSPAGGLNLAPRVTTLAYEAIND
jgi:CubicO group peptidase (beta-lactamase class C family)